MDKIQIDIDKIKDNVGLSIQLRPTITGLIDDNVMELHETCKNDFKAFIEGYDALENEIRQLVDTYREIYLDEPVDEPEEEIEEEEEEPEEEEPVDEPEEEIEEEEEEEEEVDFRKRVKLTEFDEYRGQLVYKQFLKAIMSTLSKEEHTTPKAIYSELNRWYNFGMYESSVETYVHVAGAYADHKGWINRDMTGYSRGEEFKEGCSRLVIPYYWVQIPTTPSLQRSH